MNFRSEVFCTWDILSFGAIFLFVGGLLGVTLGSIIIDDMRKEAVERNAAEWVVDQATGETTFEWKEVEP